MPDSEAPPHHFDRRIVDGSIPAAVWRVAWPTLVLNVIGGLQGIVDHVMVGHYVGFTGNAAIGVCWQIFIVVVSFISAIFTGMGVMVARFAGSNDADKVNRVVFQGFLTAMALFAFGFAPIGYFATPKLLELVNATPEVQAEGQTYLQVLFLFSFGLLIFYLLGGVLRAAGDARTPLRLGTWLTLLNLVLDVIFIRGFGPIPGFGTLGAAIGTVIAATVVALWAIYLLFSDRLVVRFSRQMELRPDWDIIRSLFRFGLPTGFQGIAMNVAGVLLIRYVGALEHSAEAQAAYAVGYSQLFTLVSFVGLGLMAAASTVAGQNLGAGAPERAFRAPHSAAAQGLTFVIPMGVAFLLAPEPLLRLFGLRDPTVLAIGSELLAFLSLSGVFLTVALAFTGALQGTGDTRSPLYISLVSQVALPLGYCAYLDATQGLEASDIWLAILGGHFLRALLSVLRFRQQRWRDIKVEVSTP